MKRKTSIIILIVTFLFCLSACQNEQAETNKVVAYINGEEISSCEIEYFKSRDRSDIINLYSEKYGITDFSDFWDKEFDGTTPSQALETKALEDACDAKIRLCLMRENGIYEDISFEALEAKAQAYNAEHKDQKNVVGINTIDLSQFYSYYISTGEMTLKTTLAEGELKPTNEEINALLSASSEMTENSAKSKLVDEKYEEYVNSLLEKAEIKTAE